MPIRTKIALSRPTEERFRDLDYEVMAQAFSIHNELGNLHDESIYQESLYRRANACDLCPEKELQIYLSHGSFRKDYYLDLCISGEMLYELKTVKSVTSRHEAQLLNYLFLTDLPHGKIINFSPPSIESRYVSTSLERNTRRQFEVDQSGWIPVSDYCDQIRELLTSLIDDWGTHLDFNLYKEALIFSLNLREEPINIFDGTHCVGQRQEAMINGTSILHFTSLRGDQLLYKKHLYRLLKHTSLKQIQWINIAGRKINLISLQQ